MGSKPSGNPTGFRKLVVGRKAYRIIYLVQDDAESGDLEIVVVAVIAGRAENFAYALALSRLQVMAQREVADERERMLVAVWQR